MAPEATAEGVLGAGLLQWAAGYVVVYLGLFGIGHLVLGRPGGVIALVIAIVLAGWLRRAVGASPADRRRQHRVI